jgi:hypothetical protein
MSLPCRGSGAPGDFRRGTRARSFGIFGHSISRQLPQVLVFEVTTFELTHRDDWFRDQLFRDRLFSSMLELVFCSD